MLPDHLIDLIRRQWGAIADHQLRSLVADPDLRRSIRRDRDLERVTPRALRHRLATPCAEQSLVLAALDAGPGGAVWGKSSSSHWGFTRYPRLPAHVAVGRTRVRGPRLGQLHLIRDLEPDDVVTHLDVPICRPEQTILWLAGMMTHRHGHEVAFERMEPIVDQAWRQRLVHGPYIHALAERSGGRGRSGIVVFRQLLETRPPDYQPAGSRLEERFEETLDPTDRRRLERQVTVDAEVVIRTVDYRATTWPLIVEINGEAHHSSLTARRHDDDRYRRLLDLGFSVVVWWENDVWYRAKHIQQVMHHLVRHPDPVPTLHRPTPAPWET